jgi:hypothetical protein
MELEQGSVVKSLYFAFAPFGLPASRKEQGEHKAAVEAV